MFYSTGPRSVDRWEDGWGADRQTWRQGERQDTKADGWTEGQRDRQVTDGRQR